MSRSVVRLHHGGYWVSQVFGSLCKYIFIATYTMQVHMLSHKCLANGLQAWGPIVYGRSKQNSELRIFLLTVTHRITWRGIH